VSARSAALRARGGLGRVTAVPLLVRAAVFGSALSAFVVAYPVQLTTSRLMGVLVLAALLPAVSPRGRGATVAVVLAVLGWLLDTGWNGQPVALVRLLVLATLIYLVHSLTALAAALPYDAVVAVDVVGRWLGRTFAVVSGSAVVTVGVLALTAPAGSGNVAVVAVAGFAAAVGAAVLLAWLLRRP
jgi:hypothetical protein